MSSDFEKFLRVSSIIETQLAPLIADADLNDASGYPRRVRPDDRKEPITIRFVFMICRCKVIGHGSTK